MFKMNEVFFNKKNRICFNKFYLYTHTNAHDHHYHDVDIEFRSTQAEFNSIHCKRHIVRIHGIKDLRIIVPSTVDTLSQCEQHLIILTQSLER
jgi:hypothetical protein